jgi:hypothetical protein
MLRSVSRQIQSALFVLLQVDPQQQLVIGVFVLFFVVAINVASNAASTLLAGFPDWLLLVTPAPVFGAFVFWLAVQRRRLTAPHDPELTPELGEYPGLVAMLGIFRSRGNPESEGLPSRPWQIEQLRAALDAEAPDWQVILNHVDNSNLQPLLQAIRHHDRNGRLRHVWLIATTDVVQPDAVQGGSRHLAPLVAKIVGSGLGHRVICHYGEPALVVLPDDIGATYRAVNSVYEQAAPQVGLQPYQVIADITGARATMTSGMILACAPRGYPLQYTSTVVDPAAKEANVLPTPQRLRIDTREILRHALEAIDARLEP